VKIGFVSLGCPKNLVDSEVMLGMAEKEGHEITADASQADVLVVNTCAFIDRAKQESIDTILEMAELKKQAHCHRLHGRALPRGAEERDPRDRRGAWHR
jgi:ribosomal protein S12 methylthiotransferase